MQEAYRAPIESVPYSLSSSVCKYLGILRRRRKSFFDVLVDASLDQADLVLALLHMNTEKTIRVAENIVGRPITKFPPDPRLKGLKPLRRKRPKQVSSFGDERRITWVGKNPRSPSSDAYKRFAMIRKGMTISQCLSRGVKRRDIRVMSRKGFIRLEKVC